MGFSISWVAVRGCDLDKAAQVLGLEPQSGPPSEFPSRLGGAQAPEGWLLIWSEDFDQVFKQNFGGQLSKFGPAVACAAEEHVMFQEARGYHDGAETWRVVHDSSEGIYHLDIHGDPPPQLGEIRSAAMASQDAEGGENAGVDMIADVPLNLAKSICGFKHDDAWDLQFTELRKAGTGGGKPGFFARLLGAR